MIKEQCWEYAEQLPVPVAVVLFVWQRHLFLPSDSVKPHSSKKEI